MKQIIRKILKESNLERFAQVLLKKVGSMSDKKIWGLRNKIGFTPQLTEYFSDNAIEKVLSLSGRRISILDYDVRIGGYEFTFIIKDVTLGEPHDTNQQNYLTIDTKIYGIVEIYDELEDDMVEWEVNKALKDIDLYEVQFEISDIIIEILRYKIREIILSDLSIDINFI